MFPRTTPSPLRTLPWAACLANDECFLCHRSAKTKKPAKKDSVMVSVNVYVWFFQLIVLTPCPRCLRDAPPSKKNLTVWYLLLLLLTHRPHEPWGEIGHSWWQVALSGLEMSLFIDSNSVYVADSHHAGWFLDQQRACVCQKWGSNTKSSTSVWFPNNQPFCGLFAIYCLFHGTVYRLKIFATLPSKKVQKLIISTPKTKKTTSPL